MTQADQQIKALLETLPHDFPKVSVIYTPIVATHGKSVSVELDSEAKLPKNCELILKIYSEEGKLLLKEPIKFPEMTASFIVPHNWSEGDYELRIVYQGWILANEILEIGNEQYAEQEASFAQGLDLETEVKNLLKKGDYSEAMKFQKETAECYKKAGNPEIAAQSWEDFAGELYEAKEYELAKEALETSLTIFTSIKSLEEKEEILARIRREIEFCDSAISSDKIPDDGQKLVELLGVDPLETESSETSNDQKRNQVNHASFD